MVKAIFYSLLYIFSGTMLAYADDFPLSKPKTYNWSFSGIFGTYDNAQLQRGLQVYKKVCSSCHSLHYINFNDFHGLGYSKLQIANLAKEYNLPTDTHFPESFTEEATARAANNGALPPDLSNLAKLRASNNLSYGDGGSYGSGANYIASVLTGYSSAQQGASGFANSYYYKAATINMPPPLADGIVTYIDGAPQTKEQYATDIAAFLYWCANPHILERKQIGFCIISFLLVLLILLSLLKKEIFKSLPTPTILKGKDDANR